MRAGRRQSKSRRPRHFFLDGAASAETMRARPSQAHMKQGKQLLAMDRNGLEGDARAFCQSRLPCARFLLKYFKSKMDASVWLRDVSAALMAENCKERALRGAGHAPRLRFSLCQWRDASYSPAAIARLLAKCSADRGQVRVLSNDGLSFGTKRRRRAQAPWRA